MKLSTALCLLPSLALAAPPHRLDKRLLDLTPVNVPNLDTEFDVKSDLLAKAIHMLAK